MKSMILPSYSLQHIDQRRHPKISYALSDFILCLLFWFVDEAPHITENDNV